MARSVKTSIGGGRAPTIRDVAARAGVSAATVSRVLNESAPVARQTQHRVRTAIEELGFRRSAVARRLSVGRSDAIGVIAPFLTTPSVVERLRGVVGALAERGHDLLLFDVESRRHRDDAFRDFARRDRVDGLIVISLPLSDAEVDRLSAADIALVLVDVDHARVPHIVVDDVHGGRLATEHLLARGHRRIAFLGDVPESSLGFTSSERRRRGYERALREAGIEPDPALVRLSSHAADGAEGLADALLRTADPPTAVFAASDVLAIGVLRRADELGVRIPEDLALIGFDDIETAALIGLTTVHQPLRDSGARAAEQLVSILAGGERRMSRLVQPLRVIERRTT